MDGVVNKLTEGQIELVRDYHRLLNLERDFEHFDADDEFISLEDRDALELIMRNALVKCRAVLGITISTT